MFRFARFAFSAAIVTAGLNLVIRSCEPAESAPQHHDVAWYMSHPAERLRMQRLCQSDSAFSGGAYRWDCANVRRAWAGLQAAKLKDDMAAMDAWLGAHSRGR
jgi:hypothetical protein